VFLAEENWSQDSHYALSFKLLILNTNQIFSNYSNTLVCYFSQKF
jgi:hypothetical protein